MTAKVSFPEEITLDKGPEIARALKDLVASEGWAYYISVVETQHRARTDKILLEPLSGTDAVYGQEYMKGEVQGLRLAVNLPQTLIETIEQELAMLKEKGDRHEDE